MISWQGRIFLATAPLDFRGSLDRLSGMVREQLKGDPRSGGFVMFLNRRADRLKILYFDGTGDCILYKRLDRRTFSGIVALDRNWTAWRSMSRGFSGCSPVWIAVDHDQFTEPGIAPIPRSVRGGVADVGPSSSLAGGAQLQEKIRSLEDQLSRALLRGETQLQHARAQVAWFHRVLFGQKAERVDRDALERGWREFLEEQERTARGPPRTRQGLPAQGRACNFSCCSGAARRRWMTPGLASAGISADPGGAR